MPPARHATATPRRQPRSPQRKRPRLIAPSTRLRVRWERVGRVGLLVVLAVVMGLYVEHTLSYFSTRSQADQQKAIVSRLARQNAQLTRRERSLNDPATIVSEARALGMVRPGERPFVITGKASP
jgi:cell division protein FtsB